MGFRGQPSFQAVCQTCHFAVACAFAQLPVIFGHSAKWGLAFVPIWIFLKEWVWDYWIPVPKTWWLSWIGEGDTWQGSLLDSTFYALGGLAMLAVFWWTGKL